MFVRNVLRIDCILQFQGIFPFQGVSEGFRKKFLGAKNKKKNKDKNNDKKKELENIILSK